MKLLVFLFVITLFYQLEAKQLSRCELVRELRRHGFPENKMRDWVCLVEKESGRRTHIVSKPNRNGSRDYGLFQINDMYWCSKTNKPGKDCNVTCKQITTNNISRAAACAKKIYQRHGFNAWYGWKNHCRGKALPNISACRK
ncbi:lysozyme-like [Battus philenor]|uniref:lysozyme-like n=1 Tax=Battus philenor TaxID=42288 RepID=UPI0035CF83A1